MEKPLISICIPTYNGEKFLQQALDSVSSQTYRNFEVIISDDASRDRTLAICEEFKERSEFPIRIYNHEPQGIGANWDHCIEKANGEWIKFLFQDDILEENCLEEFLKLKQKTGEKVFFCKRMIIDANGKDISNKSFIADLQRQTVPDFEDYYVFTKKDLRFIGMNFPYRLNHNFIGEPVASFVSKHAYLKTGKHSQTYKQLLDLEYNLRFLNNYSIVFTTKKLVRFRVHEEQATHLNWQMNVNEHADLDKVILRKYFRYLSWHAVTRYYYRRYKLLKNIRGRLPF